MDLTKVAGWLGCKGLAQDVVRHALDTGSCFGRDLVAGVLGATSCRHRRLVKQLVDLRTAILCGRGDTGEIR